MDFSKLNGLIPAVIQDDETNEVLMVGLHERRRARRARATPATSTFFSRTAQHALDEGRDVGQPAAVVSIAVDCDDDTLLIRVRREGDGNVCHPGTVTCFTGGLTARGH